MSELQCLKVLRPYFTKKKIGRISLESAHETTILSTIIIIIRMTWHWKLGQISFNLNTFFLAQSYTHLKLMYFLSGNSVNLLNNSIRSVLYISSNYIKLTTKLSNYKSKEKRIFSVNEKGDHTKVLLWIYDMKTTWK